MAKANKEFSKMSFDELVKWDMPEDISNDDWKEYESQVKQKARKYFLELDFCQLQEFYRTYSGDGIDPWFGAWDEQIRSCYPFSNIYEKIAAIEKTVIVLLKEKENEPANITVGQLNRLKGGI